MKRKSGLQKKISSIFKDLPIDELGSEAPLAAVEGQEPQSALSEPIELAIPQQQPIVDPPAMSMDLDIQPATQSHTDSVAVEMDIFEQHKDDSREKDEIQNLANDGLSFFSFDADQSTKDALDTDSDEYADNLNTDFSAGAKETKSQDPSGQAEPKPLTKPFQPKRDVDKRQIMRVAFVCVLAIGFVFAMLWAFAPSIFEEQATTPGDDIEITPLVMTSAVAPQSVWPKPELYAQDLRDPMSALAPKVTIEMVSDVEVEVEVEPNLNVKGIVYSQDNPSVIIDEGIYFVGDLVNDVTIISITRTEVVFEANGKQWTQTL